MDPFPGVQKVVGGGYRIERFSLVRRPKPIPLTDGSQTRLSSAFIGLGASVATLMNIPILVNDVTPEMPAGPVASGAPFVEIPLLTDDERPVTVTAGPWEISRTFPVQV